MNRRCMGCMEMYDDQFDVCPHCGYIHGSPAKEAYHITPGSILKKRYQVGRVLGFGGFGITYIGYDLVLNNKVAIKEYLPSEFSTRMPNEQKVTVYSGEGEEQFQAGLKKMIDEARRLAQFQSEPEIVHIYDCFEANNTAYIIMEYLDGESLKEKLDRDGRMVVDDALPIILSVISGLKKVHAEGIIHRDIAPDNIYLLKDGGVKLLDFGAARYATTQHSKSLSVIIKPGYAPEEQYRSRSDQGPWTDVYALAATFYKMLTGETPEDAMERAVKDTVKDPSKLGVKIPKSMETAIMNAMNVKIEGRTQSAEAFEQELNAAEVKRIIVKNKKADLGKLPLWVKIAVPSAMAVFAVIIALMLTGVIKVNITPENYEVQAGKVWVPDVVNQQQETAVDMLTQVELKPQLVDAAYDSEHLVGVVLRQTPGSTEEVELKSTVELTVSRGAEKVQIPNLMGMTQEEAQTALNRLGLKYEIKEVEGVEKAGTVAKQSIEVGKSVETEKTTIVIEVSKGLGDIDTSRDVTVPDLTGKQYEEAQSMLADTKRYGVYLEQRDSDYSDDIPAGAVMEQSPAAGQRVKAGDVIYVKVSLGPHMVQLPAVTLTAQADAERSLAQAGFQSQVQQEYSDQVEKGTVISASVDGAIVGEQEQVKYGATVTLIVSMGPQPAANETRGAQPTTAPNRSAGEDAARRAAEAAAKQQAAQQAAAQQAAQQAAAQQAAAEEAARQQAAAEAARQQQAAEEAARKQAQQQSKSSLEEQLEQARQNQQRNIGSQ